MDRKRDERDLDFSDKYIKWFSELSNKDVKIAGGKGANLGEMFNNKFPVPPGFVVTSGAFEIFIGSIKNRIKDIITGIDFENTTELAEKSKEIRKLIESQEMPEELKTEIIESYHILGSEKIEEKGVSEDALNILRNSQEPIFVSVRSSATTEDLADASFAGQQQSFLNIKGDSELIEHVKKCFSSLYTARAMYYRNKKGFSEKQALLAVVVQKMIDSEKSGVVFSKNPINLEEEVVVEAVFGLGEGIVSGKIKPDHYVVVNGNNLKIKSINLADKKIAIVRAGSGENKIVKLTPEKSKEQVLTRGEILEIAEQALKLEEHYNKPQDIEFAIEAGKIYIVQSRPITTKGKSERGSLSGNVILKGLGASPGVGVGNVKIIKTDADLSKIKRGDILVTEMTNPDMVVSMQKAVAIVTDEGGVTSHAAIVSREMGIPAVVGTGEATTVLKEGMKITVDGSQGKIYEGQVAETRFAEVKPAVETKTKLKLVLDLPEFAERAAESKLEHVGLLRLEGIIASSGKHPIQFERDKKLEDYTELLREGIEKIAKHFKSVWIRSSDLRSDEFGNLKGSPEEEINPMLGFHGIRFHLKYPKILEAELEAIRQVAVIYKDKEFGIMFPQIISIEEVKQAKEIFNKHKTSNMKFGVMIETPASVQIIEDICKEVDFISFGTNDLTQYTLAVDRGEDEIQELYNEMHPAVLSQIKQVLDSCKGKNIETSICGQAGSKKEMVEFLLKNGIDSISVNADAAAEISKFVRELEEKSETGFDRRKQEGMVKKEELKEKVEGKPIKQKEPMIKQEIQEQRKKRKDKRIIICGDCGRETKLPFVPRGDGPFYCKKCFKKRKQAERREKKEERINKKAELRIPEFPTHQKISQQIQQAKEETRETRQEPELKEHIGPISPIDSTEHIEDKIEDIKEEVEEIKEEELKEREDKKQSGMVEEKSEEEQGISGEPTSPEAIGIYNPDEESDNAPQAKEYNFDDEEDVFTDVF